MKTGSVIQPVEEGLYELILGNGERLWARLVECSERQLILDREIYKYLSKNNTSLFIPRKERSMFAEEVSFLDRKSICYWPTRGQKANFFSEIQQQRGAEFLADFHRALKHFKPEVLPRSTLGNLISTWERRLIRLTEFQRIAKFRASPGVFDKHYLKIYPDILSQAEHGVKTLKESKYLTFCNGGGQICVTRFRSDMFLYVQNRICAWDYSKCCWELPVVDLFRFLLYLCRHCGYNREMLIRVLASYEAIRPIEDSERYILKVLFDFPDRLYRIISNFYLCRSRRPLRRQIQRLDKELSQNEERLSLFM